MMVLKSTNCKTCSTVTHSVEDWSLDVDPRCIPLISKRAFLPPREPNNAQVSETRYDGMVSVCRALFIRGIWWWQVPGVEQHDGMHWLSNAQAWREVPIVTAEHELLHVHAHVCEQLLPLIVM